ncbi:hypothetical protein BTO06_17165 [Tenacibaculum sp. SZ-18]|uniref:Kelch repeat-containing protein n=1 Tax=Tenacibaculum sp. SZ-18 TaxID=754423 RepID=UPI000C2CF106|nr:kelch repeat-containing protein [Tenacibaculum sp. SZ-18]AUC16767.1 hypothetical protein BTO06_17165 [Tenacibaculum sp. SZ-18]
MKNKLLLFCLLLTFQIVFGQHTITVLNSKSKEPIQYVHLKKKGKIYVTDKNGKVLIERIKSNDRIFLSHVEYYDRDVLFGEIVNKSVFLTEKDIKLSEVLITKKKNKELNFEKLPELEKGLHGFASVLYNNKIYVFGGDKSTLSDAMRMALQELSGMQDEIISINELIYRTNRRISYQGYSNKVRIYDIKNKRWSSLEKPVLKRAYHKAVLIDGKAYLLGGKKLAKNKSREYLINDIEVFNLKTNKLEKLIDSKQNGINQGVAKIDNSIILVGGSVKKLKKGRLKFSNNVSLYNTKEDKWYIIGKLPDPKETECIKVNDKLFMIGGKGTEKMNRITSFNLKNGKWEIEKVLPRSMKMPAIDKKGDLIYIFDKSFFYEFNTNTKGLKEYKIDLPYESSKMFLVDNKFYLLGGFVEDQYQVKPSKKMYTIDLNELNTTLYDEY